MGWASDAIQSRLIFELSSERGGGERGEERGKRRKGVMHGLHVVTLSLMRTERREGGGVKTKGGVGGLDQSDGRRPKMSDGSRGGQCTQSVPRRQHLRHPHQYVHQLHHHRL